jgi:hypothetical protein
MSSSRLAGITNVSYCTQSQWDFKLNESILLRGRKQNRCRKRGNVPTGQGLPSIARNYQHLEGRFCWALVAHACNLRYLGGRDQEDHDLNPAPGKFQDTISRKYPTPKKGWQSGSRGKAPA